MTFPPIRMANIKQKQQVLMTMGRNWNLYALLVGMKTVQVLLKTVAVIKKFKHGITISFNNSTSGYISQRTESRNILAFVYDICSSIIYNSQRRKIPKYLSIEEGMDKQNVTYTYNEMLLSLKKE